MLLAGDNVYVICAYVGQTCVDIRDNVVSEGLSFTPKGDDPCLSCTCHDGEAEMCVAALCDRPLGCTHFTKDPKECCKFTCLSPGDQNSHRQFCHHAMSKSLFNFIVHPYSLSWQHQPE